MVSVLVSESIGVLVSNPDTPIMLVLLNMPGLDCFLVIREVMFSSSVGREVLKPK